MHISPAVVVSLLAQKIRSTLSQTSGAKLEEITHMLCVLELRFRFSASFSGRDDRQYEPPLALKHHSYSLLEMWRTKWISHDIKKSIYADDGSRVEKHTTSKAYILRSAHNLKHAARNLLQVNLEYPDRGFSYSEEALWQRRWNIAPYGQRPQPLNEEEQQVADRISMTYSGQDRDIQTVNLLSAIPFDQQSRILGSYFRDEELRIRRERKNGACLVFRPIDPKESTLTNGPSFRYLGIF